MVMGEYLQYVFGDPFHEEFILHPETGVAQT